MADSSSDIVKSAVHVQRAYGELLGHPSGLLSPPAVSSPALSGDSDRSPGNISLLLDMNRKILHSYRPPSLRPGSRRFANGSTSNSASPQAQRPATAPSHALPTSPVLAHAQLLLPQVASSPTAQNDAASLAAPGPEAVITPSTTEADAVALPATGAARPATSAARPATGAARPAAGTTGGTTASTPLLAKWLNATAPPPTRVFERSAAAKLVTSPTFRDRLEAISQSNALRDPRLSAPADSATEAVAGDAMQPSQQTDIAPVPSDRKKVDDSSRAPPKDVVALARHTIVDPADISTAWNPYRAALVSFQRDMKTYTPVLAKILEANDIAFAALQRNCDILAARCAVAESNAAITRAEAEAAAANYSSTSKQYEDTIRLLMKAGDASTAEIETLSRKLTGMTFDIKRLQEKHQESVDAMAHDDWQQATARIAVAAHEQRLATERANELLSRQLDQERVQCHNLFEELTSQRRDAHTIEDALAAERDSCMETIVQLEQKLAVAVSSKVTQQRVQTSLSDSLAREKMENSGLQSIIANLQTKLRNAQERMRSSTPRPKHADLTAGVLIEPSPALIPPVLISNQDDSKDRERRASPTSQTPSAVPSRKASTADNAPSRSHSAPATPRESNPDASAPSVPLAVPSTINTNAGATSSSSLEAILNGHDVHSVLDSLPWDDRRSCSTAELVRNLTAYIIHLLRVLSAEKHVTTHLRKVLQRFKMGGPSEDIKDEGIKGKWIIGLGFGPDIPPWLRYCGRVPNNSMGLRDVEHIMESVWASKIAAPAEQARLTLGDFMKGHFLQETEGNRVAYAELALNFDLALDRWKTDADVELFRRILLGQLPEEAYHDQRRLLAALHLALQKADQDAHHRVMRGVVPRSVIISTVAHVCPTKSDSDLGSLRSALLSEFTTDPISYDVLFASDADGHQCRFMEEFRDQHIMELIEFRVEIEQAVLACRNPPSAASVELSSVVDALVNLDPKLHLGAVKSFVFASANEKDAMDGDEWKNFDWHTGINVRSFIVSLRRHFLKRASKPTIERLAKGFNRSMLRSLLPKRGGGGAFRRHSKLTFAAPSDSSTTKAPEYPRQRSSSRSRVGRTRSGSRDSRRSSQAPPGLL